MPTEQEPTTPRQDTPPADEPDRSVAADAGAPPGGTAAPEAGHSAPEEAPPATAPDPAAQIEELTDRWRRALADLDNLRKRHAKELAHARADERARTATALLPVLDNLELALTHAGSDPSAVLEGVAAVRDQAVEVLRGLGYPRHEETGVPFDPARHEVVGLVQDPGAEPNTVVEVVRPGYGADDRQLRPASVVVAKRQE